MTATNSEQFDILIDFMEKNEGIAKNFLNTLQFKESTNTKWNEVMERLNAVGSPKKTVEGWKKVWKDFKYNTKNKMRRNNKSITGTGGGPCRLKRLSNNEERVSKLMDYKRELEGVNARKFGCGLENSTDNPDNSTGNDLDITVTEPNTQKIIDNEPGTSLTISNNTTNNSIIESEPSTPTANRNTERPVKPPRETAKSLLKRQIEQQEKYYNTSKRQRKELINVLKDNLKFKKDKWKSKQAMLAEKTKQKYQRLQLQMRELELRERELEART